MSKYTTEVRFICEQMGGYTGSQGYKNILDIVESVWNKIFDNSWNTFNPNHKQQLCQLILMHYYTWEIGFETVGLFIFKINQKLREIIPYYNLLYEALSEKFPVFENVNYTRKGTDNTTENGNNTDKETHSDTDTTTLNTIKTNTTQNTTTNDLTKQNTGTVGNQGSSNLKSGVSDTPQGSLQNIENFTYLSRGQIDNTTDNNTRTDNLTEKNTGTQKNEGNNTVKDTGTNTVEKEGGYNIEHTIDQTSNKDYEEQIIGKMGGQSYVSMFKEYAEAIRNIDMEIVEELRECFMLLW